MKKELISTFFCILMIVVVFTPIVNAENKNTRTTPIQYGTITSKHGQTYFTRTDQGQEQEYAPGELIVKFKDEIPISITTDQPPRTGIDSIDKINAENRLLSAEQLFQDALYPSSLSNLFKFTFPSDVNILSLANQYKTDPTVEYAQLNYICHTVGNQNLTKAFSTALTSDNPRGNNHTKIPNDPQFYRQWALNQSNGCDIHAPEAWYIETGSPNVTIAIVDTGVDYNHPDLAANIWNNTDEIPNNHVDDDHNGYIDDIHGWNFIGNNNNPMDNNGHGTFCAGIAAAVTNNSIGMAGVCWNSKIMPLKGLDKNGVGSETSISQCIVYAVQNGANIITISVGTYIPTDLLYTAINYAYDNGIVIVASAGETNSTFPFYPACYDQVISVTATGYNDEKLNPSDYGPGFDYGPDVDVAAPGTGIFSTFPGNQYASAAWGGGMACFYVAGVAGLLLSQDEQCLCPAQMVKTVIQSTADKVQGGDYSFGRVNAYRALTIEPFAVNLESLPAWEDIQGTIDIKGTAWGDGLLYYRLEAGIGDHPSSWMTLLNSSTPQSHIVYALDTRSLQEALYTIRLQAVFTHGTYNDTIQIHVNNVADGNHTADIDVSESFDSSTPGWGVTHFSKIQDGINKAKAGDTVFVYDGIYHENITLHGLSKSSVNVIGQNTDWTIIEGSLNISHVKKLTISGFTIRKGIINGTQIYPYFELGLFTEILVASSPKCIIANCNIVNYYEEYGNFYAGALAILFSPNTMILNNTFSGRENTDGTSTILNFLSPKTAISGNTFADVVNPVALSCTFSNVIENNNFLNCGVFISLNFAYHNLIYKNKMISSNGASIGVIFLASSAGNTVVANYLAAPNSSGFMGIMGWFSIGGNNRIYLNDFINAGAADDLLDKYDKPAGLLHGQGNYWSMYKDWYQWDYGKEPTDNNHDGFWDKPLRIQTMMLHMFNISYLDRDRFCFVNPIDTSNITDPMAEQFIHKVMCEFNSEENQ